MNTNQPLLPYNPYRIRVTFWQGSVKESREYDGPFLIDCLSAAREMFNRYFAPLPEHLYESVLTSLRNREANSEWSWFTIERID